MGAWGVCACARDAAPWAGKGSGLGVRFDGKFLRSLLRLTKLTKIVGIVFAAK